VNENEIGIWLRRYIATKLDTDIENIVATESFDSFGLDSMTRACMVVDIGAELGTELEPSIAYDCGSVHDLTHWIMAELKE